MTDTVGRATRKHYIIRRGRDSLKGRSLDKTKHKTRQKRHMEEMKLLGMGIRE